MSEPLSRIPGGMRYYFGPEARRRRWIEETGMSIFDGWSYEEITTPTVDYYSLFEHGMGKIEDMTAGAARAAATLFAKRERPLRLCYAAPVFRQQPQSHAEWRRESAQIGCELIGANTQVADLEVLAIACELLQRLRLGDSYSITLNDVCFFNGVAESLALTVNEREEMRRLIDVRNAADIEGFLMRHTSPPEGEPLRS